MPNCYTKSTHTICVLCHNSTYERLCFQFDKLKLNDRYKAEVNKFLSSQLVGFEDVYGESGNGEQLKDFLLRSANSETRIYGANDWRPALLNALAECGDFYNGGFRRALGQPIPGV